MTLLNWTFIISLSRSHSYSHKCIIYEYNGSKRLQFVALYIRFQSGNLVTDLSFIISYLWSGG